MRLLFIVTTLFFLVSCGRDSGGGATAQGPVVVPTAPQASEDQETQAGTVDDACVNESCNTITADGSVVDLLDSVVDSRVEISDSAITFMDSKISNAEGDRISCNTEVRSGDVFNYTLVDGNKLKLDTPSGSYTMSRLNDEVDGVKGIWTWKGSGEQGMLVMKTMSVVSNSRVILKTHCEL